MQLKNKLQLKTLFDNNNATIKIITKTCNSKNKIVKLMSSIIY